MAQTWAIQLVRTGARRSRKPASTASTTRSRQASPIWTIRRSRNRIDGLKAIRDQAKADAERAQAMLQNSGSQALTPEMLSKFACTPRRRIRLEGAGYRRDHLRALAQRVEVAEGEVRSIVGSKSLLLQTLVANGGASAVPT